MQEREEQEEAQKGDGVVWQVGDQRDESELAERESTARGGGNHARGGTQSAHKRQKSQPHGRPRGSPPACAACNALPLLLSLDPMNASPRCDDTCDDQRHVSSS